MPGRIDNDIKNRFNASLRKFKTFDEYLEQIDRKRDKSKKKCFWRQAYDHKSGQSKRQSLSKHEKDLSLHKLQMECCVNSTLSIINDDNSNTHQGMNDKQDCSEQRTFTQKEDGPDEDENMSDISLQDNETYRRLSPRNPKLTAAEEKQSRHGKKEGNQSATKAKGKDPSNEPVENAKKKRSKKAIKLSQSYPQELENLCSQK
jgi:hypothetical protein